MKSRVKREDLRETARSGSTGDPLAYMAKLEKIQVRDGQGTLVQDLGVKIRRLRRAQANLEETFAILREHERRRKGEHPKSSDYDYSNRALFAMASVMYGACFLKGGTSRRYPIELAELGLEEPPIHREIMEYRHKLFAHIDENSSIRSDDFQWAFKVSYGELLPNGSQVPMDTLTLPSGETIRQWREFIHRLLEAIGASVISMSKKVDSLIGPTEVIKVTT